MDRRTFVDLAFDVNYRGPNEPAYGGLVPLLPNNTEVAHQLISWWMVLFQCSILARYHPFVWTRLLDVDSSVLAVPMQRLLNEAFIQVPLMLTEILTDARSVQMRTAGVSAMNVER